MSIYKKTPKRRKGEEEREMCSQETYVKNKPYLMEYRIRKKDTQRVQNSKVMPATLLLFGYFHWYKKVYDF